jgi:aryl-alcohol dehydrogenase-like predicted oxidoreductase
MKLILGSAQFGSVYGVGSTSPVELSEVFEIINLCRQYSINEIDTAVMYGNAHGVLGRVGVTDFKIHTKIPYVDVHKAGWKLQVESHIERALEDLRVATLESVLLHDERNMFEEGAFDLLEYLREIQVKFSISRVGASLYEAPGSEPIWDDLDLIQMPGNIFDRRFQKLNFPREIYLRSAFLQGVLLMKARPNFFNKWRNEFCAFDAYSRRFSSPLHAIANFFNAVLPDAKVVFGVLDQRQFLEIINVLEFIDKTIDIPDISVEDRDLIFPSNWAV